MAHFAQLDSENKVTNVIFVNNSELFDGSEKEDEAKGIRFCQSLINGTWIQTSYNASFRKRFASIGYKYDSTLDAFIPPKPFPSWVLNEAAALWESPVPAPASGGPFRWDESALQWVKAPVGLP